MCVIIRSKTGCTLLTAFLLQISPSLEQARQTLSQKMAVPPAMSDFNIERVLGRGALGKVLKVVHKESDRVYAMKVIQVPALIKQKQVASL